MIQTSHPQGKVYTLYISKNSRHDYDTWMAVAKCFKLWDLDARGFHKVSMLPYGIGFYAACIFTMLIWIAHDLYFCKLWFYALFTSVLYFLHDYFIVVYVMYFLELVEVLV